ncbi:MAG: FadR family transcriptional regulator [Desulfobacter sp.]|nr:MAG: FadR family transcriptional regulator [Desulfobacter sp.]
MARGIYHRVESEIIRMIETGEAAPGCRLPSERALAERLKVSRNTVREAIRALVEKGILFCRRGAGSFVAPEAEEQIARALQKEMAGKRVRLAEIFEVRKMLEPAIAGRAAEIIGEAGLADLEEIVRRQEAALEKGQDPAVFDTRFHEALAKATGNSVLCSLFSTLNAVLAESRDFQPPRRAALSISSHRQILSALRARDREKASRAMADHMEKTQSLLNRMLTSKT